MNKINNKDNNNNTLTILVIFTLLITLSTEVSGHALPENNARITLRDGQIEVRVLVDVNRWQKHLQSNQAWLMGDIKKIMPSGLTKNETSDFLKQVLIKETSLMLNNKNLELVLHTALVAPAVNNASGKHHQYTELMLSAKHTHSAVEQLTIRFPKSLGRVHASFLKPKYQMVPAGKTAKVSYIN